MTTVGYRTLQSSARNFALPLAVFYPATEAEKSLGVGPYQFMAAPDAEPVGSNLPLIAVSHGSGSTPWVHRDLARFLALQGHVVLLPEHVGNSRSDNSLAETENVLVLRPAQLSAAIDAALNDPALSPRLSDRIALVGTSIGAYTALALAGGEPWAGGHDNPHKLSVDHRDDIDGLVLLSPAVGWFLPEGSLDRINRPVLIRNGAQDRLTPPWHADLIVERLSTAAAVSHECVEGAGHYSFMSPFPSALAKPDFLPAQDPEGFDRLAYQPRLHDDIAAFLRASLR